MSLLLRDFTDIYSRALAPSMVHKNELLSVQRMRGLAVLMVLAVHVEDIAHKLPGWVSEFSIYSTRLGYSAPDMFFVISGFIMSYITFTTRFEARRWLLSRFFRIFPLYMFFTSLVLLLWLYEPSMTMGSGEHDWYTATMSMLMLPQAGLPLLFVGWTVEHEIVFYTTVFLVARFLPAHWLFGVMLTLSTLAICKWILQAQTSIAFWDFHVFSLYTLQFTMGVFLYRFWNQAKALGWKIPLVLCVGLLAFGMAFAHSGKINQETPLRVIAFGGGYSMLLLALLNLEHQQRSAGQQWSKRSWLVRCGDASYSIYLIHPFILALFGKLFMHLHMSSAMNWAAILLASAICIWGGMLSHLLLEKPIIEIGKRITKHATARGSE
ncbi:acyltransferase family protein [Atopomonas hussainii]|uniref:acyltransferase family protein n=1 Tax=Atopomonas hussainii TaxID=1429083 RepID=UPI0009003883|nr:acyltransferase [Atopomonas hussainii]